MLSLSANQIRNAQLGHELIRINFPDLDVKPRNQLKFSEKFIENLMSSSKSSTIRFSPNSVDFPKSCILPLYSVSNIQESEISNFIASAQVSRVVYKAFKLLDDADAECDGFNSASDLKCELSSIYGTIGDNEIVSIFYITVIEI